MTLVSLSSTDTFAQPRSKRAKIDVDNLSVSFRTRTGSVLALDRINLSVAANEIVSVVGSSGCGKSTLLAAIGGLVTPTSGAVAIDGRLVTGPGADRGMVFQAYSLYPWLSVADNIAFGLKLRACPSAMIAERVTFYLDVIGLGDRRNALPSELSGGMRQRVAIARALANEPAVILLDEPFGALDAQTRSRMHLFMREIWQQTHTTFVLVTHDVEEAVFLSHRVCLMSSNPGSIADILTLELPEHRSPELKFSPEFSKYRRVVHQFIEDSANPHSTS